MYFLRWLSIIFVSLFLTFLSSTKTILIIPLRQKVSMKQKKTNKTDEAEQNADLFFILFVSEEKLIWRTSKTLQSLHLNRQPNMPQTSTSGLSSKLKVKCFWRRKNVYFWNVKIWFFRLLHFVFVLCLIFLGNWRA